MYFGSFEKNDVTTMMSGVKVTQNLPQVSGGRQRQQRAKGHGTVKQAQDPDDGC